MTLRGICLHLALAVWIGAGCGSPGSGAANLPAVETPADPPTLEAKELFHWKNSEARPAAALPPQGIIVASIRWGATTLAVIDPSSATMIPLAKKATGALVVSQGGNRLAYLVREGANPAKNHIEILDWRDGKSLVVEPAGDDAVLGFALDPEGKRLSYAAMDLRNSRSTHVTWRVGLLDLERQQARIAVDSAAGKIREEDIPVPFAWSVRDERLYLQGWSPFRGMIRQRVWAMNLERGEPVIVLPASNYVGAPRLSPDGARLSYLGADMGSLPPEFIAAPGAPPGNILSVIDLTTGAAVPWARGGQTAFGANVWSADGTAIFAVTQAWLKGRFRDVEIRRIGAATSLSVAKIDQSQTLKEVGGILECRDRNLYWVERDRSSAKLYANKEQNAQVLFELPDGAIELLGCMNR